ncbi:hypothetical protein D3C87_1323260 [compost metagenome]
MFDVGHDVVDQRHGDHQQDHDHRPARDGPERDDEIFEADLRGDPAHDLRPEHHQRSGDQQHAGDADGVDDRQRKTLPRRAAFDHIVSGVHRAHHQPHTSGRRPQRNHDTHREQTALGLLELVDHRVHLFQCLGWQHQFRLQAQPREEVGQMQETNQGDQEQDEGKQRKQHLIGQRRGIGRHFVIDELGDRAHHHTVDWQTFHVRKNHSRLHSPQTGWD